MARTAHVVQMVKFKWKFRNGLRIKLRKVIKCDDDDDNDHADDSRVLSTVALG